MVWHAPCNLNGLPRKPRPSRTITPLRSLTLILAVLAVSTGNFAANSSQLLELSDRYLAAYLERDYGKLGEFYSDDAVFDDPTAAGIWGQSFTLKGREEILREMPKAYAVLGDFKFKVLHRFAFHESVVLHGISHIEFDGSLIGREGTRFEADLLCTTVLTIRDGKVVKHLDHYDYAPLRKLAAMDAAISSSS